jgi:hypothetical protein
MLGTIFNSLRKRACSLSFVTGAILMVSTAASASALSGAIFTTVANGSEVNYNLYGGKDLVYLDGGPGPGAPQKAAGLPDGIYVFQVTEPSGKTLLSTDKAKCRVFKVYKGIIVDYTSTAVSYGCALEPSPTTPGCPTVSPLHNTGVDQDHGKNGAITVQLCPFNNTPNPGHEYKVWVTPLADFENGCAKLGIGAGSPDTTALDVVTCGFSSDKDSYGFVPSDTKTDNFKTGTTNNLEIDTRFLDESGRLIDGLSLTWTDTVGAKNTKYSLHNATINVLDFAHIEAVETGTHQITVYNQPGCTVTKFWYYLNSLYGETISIEINGPGTMDISIKDNDLDWTKYLYVYCQTSTQTKGKR